MAEPPRGEVIETRMREQELVENEKQLATEEGKAVEWEKEMAALWELLGSFEDGLKAEREVIGRASKDS